MKKIDIAALQKTISSSAVDQPMSVERHDIIIRKVIGGYKAWYTGVDISAIGYSPVKALEKLNNEIWSLTFQIKDANKWVKSLPSKNALERVYDNRF